MANKRASLARSTDFAGHQKEPRKSRQTDKKKNQFAAVQAKRHNKENIPPSPPSSPVVKKRKYDELAEQASYYKKSFENGKKREGRLRTKNTALVTENKRLKAEVCRIQAAGTKSLQQYEKHLALVESRLVYINEKERLAAARLRESQKALRAIKAVDARQKAKLLRYAQSVKSSQAQAEINTFRLRRKGAYSIEARKLARLMVCAGCSQSQVGSLIQGIAKTLEIRVDRKMSRRTVCRTILEGGIASELQLVQEIANAKSITVSQDSTSNRHINYESKHINVRVPDYAAGETTLTSSSKPKSCCFGVDSTLDHSSDGSVLSWEQKVTRQTDLLARSPLGKRTGDYNLKLFFVYLMGIHGDHANNEKCTSDKLEGKKKDAVYKDLGEKEAMNRNAAEIIALGEAWRKKKIDDAGGQAAWDALSQEEQNVRDLATLKALYRSLGMEKIEKLSPKEKRALTLFFWVGCCMHKDMNAFKGGNAAMMAAHALLGFDLPITLANKANTALLQQRILDPAKPRPADRTLTDTEVAALEASTRGGVKLCALAGAIFNHKDDKKGQQDAHLAYFGAIYGTAYHRFPDTSNKRFGTYGEAATELISDLQNYRNFLKHIHDSKARPGWTNIELNVWKALHDIPTLTELVVMSLYSQAVCRPYLAFVRGDDDLNALNLGPFHKEVQDHVQKLINHPKLLIGSNISPREAVLKGVEWDPVAMSAIEELKNQLPHLRELLVKFLEGSLVTWVRFSSEYAPGGLIDQSSVDERSKAWMPPTNDVNEGLLGSYRVAMRANPRLALVVFNALKMYQHNNTQAYIDTVMMEEDHRFTWAEARRREASGEEQSRRDAHAAHDRARADENTAKTAERQRKTDERVSRENDAIRSTPMLKDPAQFTEAMTCAALDVQILHYRRWDPSSLPKLKKDYKLKSQKVQVLQEASRQYQARGGMSTAPVDAPVVENMPPGDNEDEDDNEEELY